jgi:Bacterial SCP ortholog
VPASLGRLSDAEYAAVRERLQQSAAAADLKAMTKHLLAVLAERAPGHSVEVRVPPYAAVETDPETWIALATGELAWSDAVAAGRVVASGERSDLSPWLPLDADRLSP